MKTKLALALLIAAITLFACKHKHTCEDIVKPANLNPIDWNGWNDAYTVFYNFYDNDNDACHDFDGDTILCYGHIANYLYQDYPSLNPEDMFLEAGMRQQGVGVNCWYIVHNNSSERDSLIRLLNNSSHSDTCFVKGTLELWGWDGPHHCNTVYPCLMVHKLEDIYFK